MMEILTRLALILIFAETSCAQILAPIISGGDVPNYLPSTPSAVFSVRRAVSGYAGNAMLVRRSSDNTTQNIGFVGDALDTASAVTFAAGSLLYVVTWYDQSGANACSSAACDVTQATTSRQPLLVITAVGMAYVSLPSTSTYGALAAATHLDLTGDQTLGGVVISAQSGLGLILADYNTGSPFTGWGLAQGNAGVTAKSTAYWSSTKAAFSNGTNNASATWPARIALTRTSGSVAFYSQGVATGTATGHGNAAPTGLLEIGANVGAGATLWQGAVYELYAYPSALSGSNLAIIDAAESRIFGGTAQTSYAGASAVGFGSNVASTGQTVTVGNNILQYERTQAWTAIAAVKSFAPSSVASIIFTNATNSAAYPGYEAFVNPNCQLHVRIISDIASNNYIGKYGSTRLCDGAWHTVAASYDGSSTAAGMLLYVDGVIESSTTVERDTLSASIIAGTQTMMVGSQANHLDFWMRGAIDEFSLHNVVRDATYIATNTPGSIPLPDSSVVLYYHFDNNTGTTATDSSAGGHNGTLSASGMWFPGQ